MKFVYILEDEPRFQQEIVQAILQIDPKIQVRLFAQLESFGDWLKMAMTDGAAAISKGGTVLPGIELEPMVEEAHQLVLVVSKIEYMGAKQLELLKKTRKLFIDRQICTKEDPTAFVLTAFDDPRFKIGDLEDRVLNNIIFKPFDRLILAQHLIFAIDGRHPPSQYSIQNQKTTAVIEMLKSVPMEGISETGFLTVSDRPIEVGQISKYYGSHFVTERHRSLVGIVHSCEKHPKLPNQYQVKVRYFAADPIQISAIRKSCRLSNLPMADSIQASEPLIDGGEIIVVDPDEKGSSGIGGSIERRFRGIKVVHYDDFTQFYRDLDPSQIANDKDQPKAFGGLPEATFECNPKTGALVSCTKSDGKPLTQLFGLPELEWKDKPTWIIRQLRGKDAEKWRKLVTPQGLETNDDPLFFFQVGGKSYLLKFILRDQTKDGNWLLKMEEAKKDDLIAFYSKNSRLPAKPLAIFFSHKFLGDKPTERWGAILEQFKKKEANPKLFLLSAQDYSDAQEREMAKYLSDIFFKPVDRSYLTYKFWHFFSGLEVLEARMDHSYIESRETLKAANPVKVTEFSEAGFVMEYYRPITLGSFREVVLWQPYEVGAPELVATCNYSEEVQGKKGVYVNHFVLFGMHDVLLKGIRVWIRNSYILSKEGNNS